MRTMTRESALWWAILVFVVATRALNLDNSPLGNPEAKMALSALGLATGVPQAFSNPLLGALQAALFSIGGSNNVLARLPAAIAGVTLVMLPMIGRDQLGRARALIFSMLLALSPTIWFESRSVDGAVIAWCLALYLLLQPKNRYASAAAAGLLAACGADAFLPALSLLVVRVLIQLSVPQESRQPSPIDRYTVLIGAFAFLLGSTGLLFNQPGLGGAFNGFATSLIGMFRSGGVSFARLMLGLIVYELPIICVAVATLSLLWRQTRPPVLWLALCVLGLLGAIALQPGFAAALIPFVIGTCALASSGIASLIHAISDDVSNGYWPITLSLTGLTVVFVGFAGVAALQYSNQGLTGPILAICVAALALIGVCLMSAVRVSVMVPIRGVMLGLGLWSAIYIFSAGFNLTQFRPNNPGEPYVAAATTDDLTELQRELEMLGTRAFSDPHALPLTVDDSASPALRWILRDERRVQFGPVTATDSAILVPMGGQPQDKYTYIGDAFTVEQSTSLRSIRCKYIGDKTDCSAYTRWLLQRQTDSVRPTQWILWVRSDTAALLSGRR